MPSASLCPARTAPACAAGPRRGTPRSFMTVTRDFVSLVKGLQVLLCERQNRRICEYSAVIAVDDESLYFPRGTERSILQEYSGLPGELENNVKHEYYHRLVQEIYPEPMPSDKGH